MTSRDFGPEEFRATTNVSRETMDRLSAYAHLLANWQAKTNLLGPSELRHLWQRHMLDSAQLADLAPAQAKIWADLGSGAGFPGVVLAVMLNERSGFHIHLVESNARKAAFLRESVRITGAPATIHNARAEELAPLLAEVVTARALAPLPELLDFFERHGGHDSSALFLKGKGVDTELTAAGNAWSLDAELLPSATGSGGQIVRIRSAKRRG